MADTTTPDTTLRDPRAGTGREPIVPPQIDGAGNSIITGKPPMTNLDVLAHTSAENAALAVKKPANVPVTINNPVHSEKDWSLNPLKGQELNNKAPATARSTGKVIPDVPLLKTPDWGYIPNPSEALHQEYDAPERKDGSVIAKVEAQPDPNWNWRPNEGEQIPEPKPKQPDVKIPVVSRFHVSAPVDPNWNWNPQKQPIA